MFCFFWNLISQKLYLNITLRFYDYIMRFLYNNNIQLGKAIYLWYESQLSTVFSIHSVLCTNFFSFLCKCSSECKQEPSKFCYSTKVAHHYDNMIPRKKRSKAHFFSCRSDKSMKWRILLCNAITSDHVIMTQMEKAENALQWIFELSMWC